METVPNGPKDPIQHGLLQRNLLIDVPVEILNKITANLDPRALLAVSLVRKSLHEHVQDDNTWRHAFLAQYLSLSPEDHVEDSSKYLMLRRTHPSWKLEYITHDELTRWVTDVISIG